MKLSILICGVISRIKNGDAKRILEKLEFQASNYPGEVEILYLFDNKSRMLGEKRNNLLQIAKGEFVAFVDDDDDVSIDYVSTLLNAINELGYLDIFNFIVNVSLNGNPYKPCYYSKDYDSDFNLAESYHRLPNHIMAVKRELALKTLYKNIIKGEDSDYSKRLKPLLKNECNINKVLYFYNYSDLTTETQQPIK